MTRVSVAGWLAVAMATLLMAGGRVLAADEPADPVSSQEVDAAIKKAIAYIYSQQQKDNWELVPRKDPRQMTFQKKQRDQEPEDDKRTPEVNHASVKDWQWGGLSSISICALLYAGESPQQPRLKAAIEWLKAQEIWGIYAMGFRCQVWPMIPADDVVRRNARRDVGYLIAASHRTGENIGMYHYYFFEGERGSSNEWYDHSVSQYGVLGMWAISQMNIEIPPMYWRAVEDTWRRHQHPSGGWSYRTEDKNKDWAEPTLPMTAAGLATLFITQETVHAMDGLNCTGNYRDESVERGLKWVHANFSKFKSQSPYYSLYGVERIGVASGYKYFGNLNWYQVGADYLLRGQGKQRDDGSWGGEDDNSTISHNARRLPNTCFSLMFLARGRATVMMNKLDYSGGEIAPNASKADSAKVPSWNERSRDVANIARWTGRQIERDLNWQIVNLQVPVDELHDAPILWISGKDALNFKAPEMAKLKLFIEQGGLILGNADGGNRVFAESFRKLGRALFPAYDFRELPDTHPIFANQQFRRKAWRQPPLLQGLSNGSRELMLLFPTLDPARSWQMQSFAGAEREVVSQLMVNIFLYSVDKRSLRYKGETYIVSADPQIKANRTIKVARLQYTGNWDPEPGGWRRLANLMHNQQQTDLNISVVKLGEGKLLAKDFPVAHLTGTGKFRLRPADQAELKAYVADGGTLVIEAGGGNADFNISKDTEVASMFPDSKGLPNQLKADHAVFAAGTPTKEFLYRASARRALGNVRIPQLRGLEQGGKVRVFVSSEDLSTGLVGQSVDGIYGYDPETAVAIMSNIICYAAGASGK